MMACMEKCELLVKEFLCIGARYCASSRFTLLSDLMVVSLLSNNPDPDRAPILFSTLSAPLACACVCMFYVHMPVKVSVCVCVLRAGPPLPPLSNLDIYSAGLLPVIVMKQHHSPPLKQLRLQLIGLHERRGVR